MRSAFVVSVGATLFLAAATSSWAGTQPQHTNPDSAASIPELPKVKKPSGEDKSDRAGSKASEKESAKQGKGKKSTRPVLDSTASSSG